MLSMHDTIINKETEILAQVFVRQKLKSVRALKAKIEEHLFPKSKLVFSLYA